jgi:nucleotidyltransferase/DNA polymerase involved in DNA repair
VHGAVYARPLLLDQLEVIIGSVEIRAKIKQETELNASAGISYNKFLAKLASDHRKPNGQ